MFRILCIFAIWIGWSSYHPIRGKSVAPSMISMTDVTKSTDNMTKRSTTKEFIAKASKKHPNINFDKVQYVTAISDVTLVCKTCGLEWDATPNSILNGSGCPHCGRTKLVLGVGINDVPTPTRSGNIRNDAYRTWKSMLERCYSDKYHQKEPAYIGCSVCDDWIRFSNFKQWFDNPKNGYKDGYQLDKDLLLQGNKVYSPDTCCFLPREINAAIQVSRINENNGVKFNKKSDYTVRASLGGKIVNVGKFKNINDARNAYINAKKDNLLYLADKYYVEGKISYNIYNALINFDYKCYYNG